MYENNSESVIAVSIYFNDRIDNVRKAISSVIDNMPQCGSLFIVLDGPVGDDVYSYIDDLNARNSAITVLRNQNNSGLAYSMNRVIECVVRGGCGNVKYFFRMDADDICFPDRFIKQINYLEANNLDVVGANCVEIDSYGNQIGVRHMPELHEQIIEMMPRRCVINHPTALIRFDIFRAGYRYNSELMNTQDYYLWADLLAAGYRFGNVPESLLYFRRDANFLTRRGRKKALNDLKARFNMMSKLNRMSPVNIIYAISFFCARMMPEPMLKLLYRLNGYLNRDGGSNV